MLAGMEMAGPRPVPFSLEKDFVQGFIRTWFSRKKIGKHSFHLSPMQAERGMDTDNAVAVLEAERWIFFAHLIIFNLCRWMGFQKVIAFLEELPIIRLYLLVIFIREHLDHRSFSGNGLSGQFLQGELVIAPLRTAR